MPSTTPARHRIILTRRGRLVRSILVLLAAAGILIGGTLAIRSLAPSAGSDTMELDTEGGGTTEAPTVEEEAEVGSDGSAGIEHSGTVGEGTWTVSAVASAVADGDPSDAAAAVRTGADPRHLELPDRGEVVLNSDRWLRMTPTCDDLDEYRAYMVNHEVGHFLGHDHAACPGKGEPAPVMLQQSMALEGCLANG